MPKKRKMPTAVRKTYCAPLSSKGAGVCITNTMKPTFAPELDDVSKRLRDEQVPALRLDSFMRGNTVYYLLVPDELYGLGEKTLPR